LRLIGAGYWEGVSDKKKNIVTKRNNALPLARILPESAATGNPGNMGQRIPESPCFP
jgi:hypothetical protein